MKEFEYSLCVWWDKKLTEWKDGNHWWKKLAYKQYDLIRVFKSGCMFIHTHITHRKRCGRIYTKAAGLKAQSLGQQAALASPEQGRFSGPHPDEEPWSRATHCGCSNKPLGWLWYEINSENSITKVLTSISWWWSTTFKFSLIWIT